MPPRVFRPAPLRMPTSHMLDLDQLPPPRVRYVGVTQLGKDNFDQSQCWVSSSVGRRLTQAETFDLLMAELLQNEDGLLAGMPAPA